MKNLTTPFITCSLIINPCTFRSETLEKLDDAYGFFFPANVLTYPSHDPQTYYNKVKECQTFSENYGYFSEVHPLVGKFTPNKQDIDITLNILKIIHEKLAGDLRIHATNEILSKVLAYRDLKEKMEIPIPIDDGKLTTYTVDTVFNLWHGMPAFALLPKDNESASPLLIYRGTEFSLKGWGSILSDLDFKGPGFSAFRKAQPSIHAWLEKIGKKTRVLGFSLGGALTAYTLLFEKDLISSAVAFNMPGLSLKNYQKWQTLENLPPFTVYLTQGDFVAKIGRTIGNLRICSLPERMKPLTAHTTLISFASTFYLSKSLESK